jgi:hypothetical protein
MIKGNYKQLSWIPIVAGSYSIHLQTWYLKVNNRDCTAWNRSYRLKLDKNELVDTHAQFIWIPTNQSLDFTEKGITGKKENNSKYRVLHELALTSKWQFSKPRFEVNKRKELSLFDDKKEETFNKPKARGLTITSPPGCIASKHKRWSH